jgi:hypothetical protein
MRVIIAIAVFLVLVVVVYLMRKRRVRPAAAGAAPAESPKMPASEASRRDIPPEPAPEQNIPATDKIPMEPPKAPAVETPFRNIPQDSTLKRHYLTHLVYMIQTVTFPRPTDSVLRRHYEHLIASELYDCLSDEAKMKSLICRYEEHRKDAAN